MSAITYTIVTCIEYLRGLAAQAHENGHPQDASTIERAADGMWRERARIAKETKAAFGPEDEGRQR